MSLTIYIPLTILSLFGLSVGVGYYAERRDRANARAADTYRAIVHRGGVTAPIPFASQSSTVNAPGLVQVHPHSHLPTSPPSTAPLAGPSVTETDEQSASALSATIELPTEVIELSEQPTDEEGEIIVSLWEEGYSMTKIIRAVWGVKPGGSKAYISARNRYKHYLQELVVNA